MRFVYNKSKNGKKRQFGVRTIEIYTKIKYDRSVVSMVNDEKGDVFYENRRGKGIG